jgi:hypothetical protein
VCINLRSGRDRRAIDHIENIISQLSDFGRIHSTLKNVKAVLLKRCQDIWMKSLIRI